MYYRDWGIRLIGQYESSLLESDVSYELYDGQA